MIFFAVEDVLCNKLVKKIKVLAPLFKSDAGESNMVTFMCNTENTKYRVALIIIFACGINLESSKKVKKAVELCSSISKCQ